MREGKGAQLVLMPRQLGKVEAKQWKKPAFSEWLVRMVGFFLARAVPFAQIAPFGLAFLAMERRFSLQSLITFLLVSMGYLSLADGEMLFYIGACAVYEAIVFLSANQEVSGVKGRLVIAVMAVAFFGIGRMFWTGIGFGVFLRLLLDCGLTAMGVLVFDRCRGMMEGKKFLASKPTVEEKAALCIMCGIALLSFQNLPIPFDFSLANVLGLVILGAVGVCSGVVLGTAAGLAIGLILGLNGELLTYLAVFGCSGFGCGIARRYGKWGAAIAVTVIGISLSCYAMFQGGEKLRFYEIPVGATLLGFLPGSIFTLVAKFTDFDLESEESARMLRTQLEDKLCLAANSFENLAQTFVQISDKQNQVDLEDIALMFDTAAERVCSSCSRVRDCWQKNFNATYKTMFRFLEILERKGVLEAEDAGEYFAGRCLRQESLTRELNRLFEVYKINQVWKSKLCENRELVGQQFLGVAETLRRISDEVADTCVFDSLAAEEIHSRLIGRGIAAEQVWVMQPKDAGRKVQIATKCIADEETRRDICGVLKGVLGIGFLPARDIVCDTEDMIRMQFYESPGFRMATGCASTCRLEENGDSHILNHLQGGKFLATLSDGMGNGHRASRESGAIITLLENFMEAGFDKTVAVKLINSVMVMKSANDAFATVDMCMIDLNTGEAEFIKNGAEPSYIKRGRRIETIRSASLPVGIISQVEIERFIHRLNKGDMVVMVSDGMELKQGKEGWIRHSLEKADPKMPPQELADRLMEKAIALKGGEADDDMTVIILKLE